MILGASYNLFDSEELLEGSIRSIRDSVDYISVVFQTISNFGNAVETDVAGYLDELQNDGLIDEIVHYVPDLTKHPHFNERVKRNIGLELSIENKCSHHLSIDADEYYEKEPFELAKIEVETKGYDSSACRLLTYYKDNRTVLDPMENYYVPFIYKIDDRKYGPVVNWPVLVDPTRRMEPEKCKVFKPEHLIMHHFSYVRKSIKKKLENSSAKENWDQGMMDNVLSHLNKWQPGMPALLAPATVYNTKQIDPKFKLCL